MKKFNKDKLIWENYKDKDNDKSEPNSEDLMLLELKTRKIPHKITQDGIFIEEEDYNIYFT